VETLIGLVKQDPNSYLNHCCDPAVKLHRNNPAIDVQPSSGGDIRTLSDILRYADVF
jgi:hypothetical protein